MKVQQTKNVHGPFHKLVTWIAAFIALSGVGMGVWFFFFFRRYEQTNDAQVEQYVTPIVSRVAGYITDVRYNENQLVHKGDTLIVIDNAEYKARLDMALADMETATGNVQVLQQDVAAVASHNAVYDAQLQAAKVQQWKAKQEYDRYSNLLAEDAATVQQVETMKAAYETATARYTEILQQMQTVKASSAEAAAKVPVGRQVVRMRKAAATHADIYVGYTVLTAPYDGWVGRKTVQPGQMVKEGQALVSVVSKEKWVTANFKETQVAQIAVGQPIAYTADATGSVEYKGIVESLSPASGARFSLLPPDNATGNFVKIEQRIPVRIQLLDSDSTTAFLKAGMNVTVTAKHLH